MILADPADAPLREGAGDGRHVTAPQRPGLRFSDVAGLQEAKASLAEAVIMPVQFPHLFTGEAGRPLETGGGAQQGTG